MQVLVDDTLALMANLGVLDLPDEVELPLLTVYAFQLRLAGALAVDRPTTGHLARIFQLHGPADGRPDAVLRARTDSVHTIDPTDHAQTVAQLKAGRRSLVASEVIAVARSEGAEVRLSPGNAEGALVEAMQSQRVPYAVWQVVPRRDRYEVTTQ